jgi:hypothetical protein
MNLNEILMTFIKLLICNENLMFNICNAFFQFMNLNEILMTLITLF